MTLIRPKASDYFEHEHVEGYAAPGSTEEMSALERIDRARDEERAQTGETFASRRAASARYWRMHS